MLTKLLVLVLLAVLASKLGLRAKLRELRPRFELAVNVAIVVLVVGFGVQLLWLYFQKHRGP
jgi:hypothetical protein